MEISRPPAPPRTEAAHIGKSVVIKGELSGSEDLYLDGEVEGSIDLLNHNLTIGPHGKVRAQVKAQDVVIHGSVEGNVHGGSRVELKKTASLTGDIVTRRIVVEEGAVFKGSIETQREAAPEPKREISAAAVASSSGATVAASPNPSPAFATTSVLGQKK